MLWNNTQESWKDFLKRCLQSSAGDLKLNQEMQADEIVKVHNNHGGAAKTGLHFNPASVTEGNRIKANNMTLHRYMEREELFELAPYILGGMSDEAKLAFANQYLAPAGIRCSLSEKEEEHGFGIEHACDAQISLGRSFESLVVAAKDPTPQNLDIADREAAKAAEKLTRMRRLINGAKKAASVTKAAIGRVCHKKERV
jgi:hypothetical protein